MCIRDRLLAVAGPAWAASPTLLPALAVGLGTIVAPWFVMQPATPFVLPSWL